MADDAKKQYLKLRKDHTELKKAFVKLKKDFDNLSEFSNAMDKALKKRIEENEEEIAKILSKIARIK